MNRKEAILITVVLFATFIGGVFADTLPTSPTRTTLQTTSTDMEVVKFAGVGVPQSDAYTTPTAGLAVGNLTVAFSFAPASGFQQINSAKATIIYHAATFYGACNPCSLGDRFNIRVNGQAVASFASSGSVYPTTTVVSLGNLRIGSNMFTMVVSNPTAQFPGVYYVYDVRLTVEYTFLA